MTEHFSTVPEEFIQSVRDLWRWASERQFKGNDPHDLLTSPLLRRLPSAVLRLAAVQFGRRSPINLRRVLGVPSAVNPKALALYLDGVCTAQDAIGPDWRAHAGQLQRMLLELQADDGGWGYPFGWQSRTHFIPEAKSNIVTTAFAGIALSHAWHVRPDEATHRSIRRAVSYVTDVVSRVEGPAFGYAQDDPQIVFNASLLGAELLANASVILQNEELLQLARRAAQFVVDHQRVDGSWIYGLEPSQGWIDSFHTGFVINSLFAIAAIAGDTNLERAAAKGLEYYKATFLRANGAIRYFPGRDYPVDAHSMGQGISMLARHGALDEAIAAAQWCNRYLHSSDGYYYYQKHRYYTNRIAYMRWSNAWMFKGLTDLVTHP